MIHIAVVEDEQVYIQCLQKHLEKYMKEKKLEIQTEIFRDGADITEKYQAKFDIIFMDIQMKFQDGMSAAEVIRKMDKSVIIIFVTNMLQYAIRGYAVNALDYVLKPIDYFTFSQKLDKAVEKLEENETHYVAIATNHGIHKMDIDKLYYVESQNHALIYHTTDDIYTTRGNMKETEDLLSHYGFYRSHKGYLVNLKHVEAVRENYCIVNSEMLLVSRARKKNFMEVLTNYISRVMK